MKHPTIGFVPAPAGHTPDTCPFTHDPKLLTSGRCVCGYSIVPNTDFEKEAEEKLSEGLILAVKEFVCSNNTGFVKGENSSFTDEQHARIADILGALHYLGIFSSAREIAGEAWEACNERRAYDRMKGDYGPMADKYYLSLNVGPIPPDKETYLNSKWPVPEK